MSGSGSVLPNVLVSLSGANFRSNNFTNEQGTLEYYRLVGEIVSMLIMYWKLVL